MHSEFVYDFFVMQCTSWLIEFYSPISTTALKEYENKNTIVSKKNLKIPKG